MSETQNTILDAAEARIRVHGYHGVSFRDLAQDVGIKSASVHYYFPTKADLAEAVARRYRQRVHDVVEADRAAGADVVQAWCNAFRRALTEDGKMCLCGVLAAESGTLPETVRTEAREFFRDGIASIDAGGNGRSGAEVFGLLEGALLLAQAMDDTAIFDQATHSLIAA